MANRQPAHLPLHATTRFGPHGRQYRQILWTGKRSYDEESLIGLILVRRSFNGGGLFVVKLIPHSDFDILD